MATLDTRPEAAVAPAPASGGTGRPAGKLGEGVALEITPRLITDMLDHTVAEVPADRVAIDFMGARTTYGDLAGMVDRAAKGLQGIGVTKGMRVGLCLPNMPAYPVLYFALHRIGAIVVNINPLYTRKEIRHLLEDSGAEMVAVVDVAEYHEKVASLVGELGLKKLVVCRMTEALPWLLGLLYRVFKRRDIARLPADGSQVTLTELLANDGRYSPVDRKPDDTAVLQYTGGTTGVPKAAMLSHANLTANCAQTSKHVENIDLDPADQRVMGVLPLFHVFALTAILDFTIDRGATMVLLPRFEMKQFLKTMKRTRCTQLLAVPTIYSALNHLPEADLAPFRSLVYSISGGAPLPHDVRAKFEQRTGCKVIEGYGLSEASPTITCNPPDGVSKDNSCGVPFPGTTIEIRDLEDPHRILPRGEKGEVCARGPQVMKGYWNRPEDNEAVFVDGALRTGDVGYLDEENYLFLVDRIKDVILAGGYNIYPRTIEEALYQHPAIADAVVIGVDDEYRGQAPKAFVTLKAGQQASPEELKTFLKDHLNKLEMPKAIEIRKELPKTLIGKLSKKELVEEERAKAAGGTGDGGGG